MAWRVVQSVDVDTTNLEALPKVFAAVQNLATVNRLEFGLTTSEKEKLDQRRIEAAYKNFMSRAIFMAGAMNRSPADFTIESLTLDGADQLAQFDARSEMRMAVAKATVPIQEPSFEPGETVLTMQLAGKIRFK